MLESRIDPADVVDLLETRYAALWSALTGAAEFKRDDLSQVQQWVESLNELGFDVDEMDIVSDPGGDRLQLHARVVEAGHHRRELLALTGLDVEEAQARRLLNDMASFAAYRDLSSLPREVVANRWLTEVWERLMALVPRELLGRLEPAEIFHEVLQHRWFLSERASFPVDLFDAAADYMATVLATKPEEALATPADDPLVLIGEARDGEDDDR